MPLPPSDIQLPLPLVKPGHGKQTADNSGQARLAYTRTEVAEILGVTPVTVDRLTRRGLLKPSRATRRPLYPTWELERFLRDTTSSVI
jgi:hypothetical protein